MTLNASGSAGAVHPIAMGGGGGRKLPPWVWLVALIVVALHVAALLVLTRLGVIRVPATIDPDRPDITVMHDYPPPPVRPNPTPPRHRNQVVLRPPQGPVDTKVDPLPIPPQPGHPEENQGATTLAHEPPQPPVLANPEPLRAPPVISQPRWISQPSSEEMARFYPQGALDQNLEGRALLRCMVTAQGTVTNCAVVSETPPGHGFGRAAQGLSRYFRMTPRTEDGRPVEGAKVDIPLQFRL